MIQNHENLAPDGVASPESSSTPASGDPLILKMPTSSHEQTLELDILDRDPDWEVIDKGGNVVPSGAFADADEAIDAEIVSRPLGTNPYALAFAASLSHFPASSLPDYGEEDLYATQPKDDEVMPTAARKQVSQRKAKRTAKPLPRPAWQPGIDQRFLEVLAERTSSGTKFSPSKEASLSSSVQQSGERISAQVVERALEYVEAAYHSREDWLNRVRIPRVKQLVIRLCEILAFQDLVHPCVRNYDFMSEAFAALRGIEAGLKRWSDHYDE